jgi:LEA14-like dessication related protein
MKEEQSGLKAPMRRLLLLSIICLLLVGVGLGLYFWLRGGVGKPEVSIIGASFEEASPTTVTIDVYAAIDNPNPLGATLTSLHIDIYFNRDGEWTYLATTDKENIAIGANGRTPITLPVVVEDLSAIQAVWQFLSAHGSIEFLVTGTACIKVGPISPCLPFEVITTVGAGQGQLAAANSELEQVKTAGLGFFVDNGYWPATSNDLTPTYISGVLKATYYFDTSYGWVLNAIPTATGWTGITFSPGAAGPNGTSGQWVRS